jgi:hypothetical protein
MNQEAAFASQHSPPRETGKTKMFDETENVIRYKWNSGKGRGYRLRFDAQSASRGGHQCYRVEDWDNHFVINEWGCESLDEALRVLRGFLDIDVGQERHRLAARFQGDGL